MAHNCHIENKCSQEITNRSHEIQIFHSKFKLLTASSNRSQRITNHSQQITNCSQQIPFAHSKFKSLTANYKSLTTNYKSPTANSNRPQQIKVAHRKFKLRSNSLRSNERKSFSSYRSITCTNWKAGMEGSQANPGTFNGDRM